MLPPLAIRVTVLGAVITDPCIWGKPLVRDAASRTKGAAEEDRHGAESRAVNFHSGGNAFPRFGAADNDYAYCSLRHGCLVESRRKQRQGAAYRATPPAGALQMESDRPQKNRRKWVLSSLIWIKNIGRFPSISGPVRISSVSAGGARASPQRRGTSARGQSGDRTERESTAHKRLRHARSAAGALD